MSSGSLVKKSPVSNALPSGDEVEEFHSRVDEVSRLIDGLSKGTITPEYIDSKLEESKKQEQKQDENAPCQEDLTRRDEELQKKVAELKARMEMKKQARKKYEEYMEMNGESQAETDYVKWDMWCPSDEDDDLLANCTPNCPQLRSMEKDIDERHARMTRNRQRAERCRVSGIEAFKKRQWTEAYRYFQEGATAENTNARIHSNAAMAALQMSCYVQAIEHCDKVIRLHDFMLNKPEHPLVAKAWHRKAAALLGLEHYSEAVDAMESALLISPDDREIIRQTERVQQAYNEKRQLGRLISDKGKLPILKEIERCSLKLSQWVEQVTELPQTSAPHLRGIPKLPPSKLCQQQVKGLSDSTQEIAELRGHLSESDESRMYFRSCGGLTNAAHCLSAAFEACSIPRSEEQLQHIHEVINTCALVLNEACMLDTNGHVLCGCVHGSKKEVQTISSKLHCDEFLSQCCSSCKLFESVALLLHTLTTDADSRLCVARVLCSSVVAASGGSSSLCLDLIRELPSLDSSHQVLATSFVANCVAEHGCGSMFLNFSEGVVVVEPLKALFLSGDNPVLIQHVASLMANAALYPHIRKSLASSDLVTAVVQRVNPLLQGVKPAEHVLVNCLTFMYNLSVEKQCVALHEYVLSISCQQAAKTMLSYNLPAVTHLSIAILARSMVSDSKQLYSPDIDVDASILAVACGAGAAAKLTDFPSCCDPSLAQWDEVSALKVIDATVRYCAAYGALGHRQLLCAESTMLLLLWCTSSSSVLDGCAGNAALCLGYLADNRLSMDLMREKNVVKALIDCAYKRKGTSASRNAAISASKLAKDPVFLDQMRECHGFEVIRSYVKFT